MTSETKKIFSLHTFENTRDRLEEVVMKRNIFVVGGRCGQERAVFIWPQYLKKCQFCMLSKPCNKSLNFSHFYKGIEKLKENFLMTELSCQSDQCSNI